MHSFRFGELQGSRVDAVAKSSRSGAVVEYMSQMGVAHAAQDLGPRHEEGSIGLRLDVFFSDRSRKAGPSSPRLKLHARTKQVGAAASTLVGSCLVVIPESSRKWPFSSLSASNSKLFGGKLLLPFFFGFGLAQFCRCHTGLTLI